MKTTPFSDPADFPNLADGELPDVSVPAFTDDTKMTKTSQRTKSLLTLWAVMNSNLIIRADRAQIRTMIMAALGVVLVNPSALIVYCFPKNLDLKIEDT